MTALVMMAILLFGIGGYRSLSRERSPQHQLSDAQVQASLPGASPETMAASVATPLERQFSTVPGLDSMTSLSGRGQTNITLPIRSGPQYRRGRSGRAECHRRGGKKASAQQCPRRLRWQRSTLPTSRFSSWVSVPTRSPCGWWMEYAETIIAPRISTLSGVAQVNVFGSMKFAVRVQVDRTSWLPAASALTSPGRHQQAPMLIFRRNAVGGHTRPLRWRRTAR